MASILDAGVATIFAGIFVFLLVYAIVWGALSKFKIFGDKVAGSYAIIAFAVAFLMAIAPPARNFVMFVAPWYLAFAIVIFFILFIFGMFGVSPDKTLPEVVKDGKVHTWIIIVCVLIAIAGIAFTYGQSAYEAGNPQVAGQVPTGTYQTPGTVGTTTPSYTTGVNPYGPPAGQPGSTATPSFQANFINTIIHPKVLGLLVTFFIAAVAIYFLSAGP
jgi:hypothetical protein